MAMAFVLPADAGMGEEERRNLERLRAAGRAIAGMSETGGVTGDASHLADAVDAIEQLANVMRRARASAERAADDGDNVL